MVSNHQTETVKHYLTIILAGSLIAGASSNARADHAVAREAIHPGTEPQVFDIAPQDAAMKKAVQQARLTVGAFVKALKHPAVGQHDFEVKKPFIQGDVIEHLWLSGVTFSGNRFHGYVDNVPRKIKGVKMGDLVSVNPDEMSDWAFVQNGALMGGYTIRVLYSELPPAGRAALEKEARFTISPHG
jgi:uncharacterized protein YegJ (DUF2314 family)